MIDLEMARTYRELMARAIHKINQRNEGADYTLALACILERDSRRYRLPDRNTPHGTPLAGRAARQRRLKGARGAVTAR
jgi:hypothetical protein